MSDSSDQQKSGTGTTIAELFSELGIAGFLQPGIVRAISHLFVGVVDVPAAYLEGLAQDIRSTTEARRYLRIEAARSLANGFQTNSGLAARAYVQHVSKILKEQVNIEEVLRIALKELSNTTPTDQPKGAPDDDWLDAFRNEASQRSTEEMRYAFGQILAGEIQEPGTYSIRTVRTLGVMETQTAALFRRLCNMIFVIPGLSAIAITPGENTQGNALREFGISFFELNILQEHGLIISDFNSWIEFTVLGETKGEISCAGRGVNIFSTNQERKEIKIRVHGVALSSMGKELYQVVELEENLEYMNRIAKYLTAKKMRVEFDNYDL